jgi:hypothetical protein
MSHPDAETALKIYRRFCAQTELVVAYLAVAKKLENILNVPIPNLKHVGTRHRSKSATRALTHGSCCLGTHLLGRRSRRIFERSEF